MVYGYWEGHLQKKKAWRKFYFIGMLSLSKETFMLKVEALLSIVSHKLQRIDGLTVFT